jgi:hypothetical protein
MDSTFMAACKNGLLGDTAAYAHIHIPHTPAAPHQVAFKLF